MPPDNSLGLAAAKAKTAEQVERQEIVGRLLKPVPPEEKVSQPVRTGPTVTIACKVPMGLLLRLFDMVETHVQVFGGGVKAIKKAQQRPETFTLRGPGAMWGNPNLPGEQLEIINPAGYAMTHGIPLDFWREWYAQNKSSYVVQNGLVFAANDERDARVQAQDGRGFKSGLEPLDPENPAQIQGPDERIKLRIERGDRPSLIAQR